MKISITTKDSGIQVGRILVYFYFIDEVTGIHSDYLLIMLPHEWKSLRVVLGSGAIQAQSQGTEVTLKEEHANA